MNLNLLLSLLSIIDALLLFIIVVIIIAKWNVIDKSVRFFGYFVILSFIVQAVSFIIATYQVNNFFLLHILTLGELLFLSLFYYHLLDKSLKIKKIILYLLPVFIILIILNSIFREPLTGWNSTAKTFTQSVLIIYSVAYFYQLSTQEIVVSPKIKSLHLINSAILLYYAGSLFIFMLGKIVMDKLGTIQDVFWVFNAVLYFAFCILILIGTWKIAFKQKN